ncbi:MAG: hypothetical protein UW84_C0036G0009 [Candidatus Collierbacteria bacterium GW2011_GWA2_44_99]|uniref:Uncharacterized protein n=1 Tax=Candidatus Collierbacteria bacterium GW2011_GWA2_44_99 TaxID=1618380 RepID=A0A0G1MX03_9BACT|nr:MAG: hypothetical protein UW84_C0036G0009 [Candidatus Collierbacteria bacterium GW2011_GWA2_44_99]
MWGKIWDMKKIILGLALSLFLLSGLPALAVATRSAEVDLTVPYEAKDRLVSMLKSQKVSGWWVGNSLKLSIRRAVTVVDGFLIYRRSGWTGAFDFHSLGSCPRESGYQKNKSSLSTQVGYFDLAHIHGGTRTTDNVSHDWS